MCEHEAIILVGGRGTRLRSIIPDRPKPMAEVAGKPFLERIICNLCEQGIRRVILATGYKAEIVREYFGDGSRFGLDVCYSHEYVPLGTGGAVRKALTQINNDFVFVVNGDSFCDFDASRMLRAALCRRARAIVWSVYCDDAGRYGAMVTGDDQRILSFSEKRGDDGPGWINAGVYLFNRETIEEIEPNQTVSLEYDIFPSLTPASLFACPGDGQFVDIGTPESYRFALEMFSKRGC